jgi:tetratricopeptide (TPR) repeat protein
LTAGIQRHNQREWDAAIAHFDSAIAAGDLTPGQMFIAYLDRAQAQLVLKHFEQAVSDYSSSLQLRQADPAALVGRAAALESVEKYDAAVADLDALVAIRPKLPSAYRMRANVNLERGRRDDGVADFKTMLSLVPEAGRGNRAIGIVAWLAQDYGQAEKSFSHASDQGYAYIYAWFWYALTELRLGKPVPRRDVPDFDAKKWPAPVAALYLGKAPPEAALAITDKDVEAPARQCQADFFVGEWLLQGHDDAGAKPLITKAVQDCRAGSLEWSAARMELGAP